MDRGGATTGDTSCLSLETALGGYSSTSRLTRCITVMTTGRMGRFHTPFGTVAFSHDDRIAAEVRAGTVDSGRPPQVSEPRAAREWLPKCYVAEIPEMPLSNLTLLNHRNMKMTATLETKCCMQHFGVSARRGASTPPKRENRHPIPPKGIVFHDRAHQNCQPDDIGNRKEQTKQRDHGRCLSISTRAFQLFLMEAE